MPSHATRELRFGVRAISGRAAATWKVWNESGNEVYISCRALGGSIKVSLHKSGQWHVSLSPNAYDKVRRKGDLALRSRFVDTWLRPPARDGMTVAYQIVVPWFAITSRVRPSQGKVVWVPPPPEQQAVEFAVIFTSRPCRPGEWPGQRAMGANLVGHFQIPSGEHVWVVWTIQPFSAVPSLREAPAYFIGYRRRLRNSDDLRSVWFVHTSTGARALYDLPLYRRPSQ